MVNVRAKAAATRVQAPPLDAWDESFMGSLFPQLVARCLWE
jgi:hypothetical protein